MMDKEYAISFKDAGGDNLQELGIGRVKTEAISHAKFYLKRGATEMVLKLYEEGDLRHQWDYKEGKWIQYE